MIEKPRWNQPAYIPEDVGDRRVIRYNESKFLPLAIIFAASAILRASRKKIGNIPALILIMLSLPFIGMMAWVSPTTRATSFLVTAAVWNADAVDNVIFLHARKVSFVVTPQIIGESAVAVAGSATLAAQIVDANSDAHFSWVFPSDFSSLDTAKFIYNGVTTGTSDFDAQTAYGNYTSNQAADTHTGSSIAAGESITLDLLYAEDLSGLLSSAAADDAVYMSIEDGGVGPVLIPIGMLIEYTRS